MRIFKFPEKLVTMQKQNSAFCCMFWQQNYFKLFQCYVSGLYSMSSICHIDMIFFVPEVYFIAIHVAMSQNQKAIPSLKLTARTWKMIMMVGIRLFPFGIAYFQGQTVSVRECNFHWFPTSQHPPEKPLRVRIFRLNPVDSCFVRWDIIQPLMCRIFCTLDSLAAFEWKWFKVNGGCEWFMSGKFEMKLI